MRIYNAEDELYSLARDLLQSVRKNNPELDEEEAMEEAMQQARERLENSRDNPAATWLGYYY